MWWQRQRLKCCSCKTGKDWQPLPEGMQKQRRIFPFRVQRELTYCFQTCSLQNCDTIYFCCFGHLVCGGLLWQPWETNTSTIFHGMYSGHTASFSQPPAFLVVLSLQGRCLRAGKSAIIALSLSTYSTIPEEFTVSSLLFKKMFTNVAFFWVLIQIQCWQSQNFIQGKKQHECQASLSHVFASSSLKCPFPHRLTFW